MGTIVLNAKDTLLTQNSGTLPQMSDALLNWFQPMTFTRVTKNIVNFVVVETAEDFDFMGVWQVMSPQMLMLKPTGQRAFKWFTVHTLPTVTLIPDEVITYLGVQYRVREVSNYTQYGYLEYHLQQDFTGSGP